MPCEEVGRPPRYLRCNLHPIPCCFEPEQEGERVGPLAVTTAGPAVLSWGAREGVRVREPTPGLWTPPFCYRPSAHTQKGQFPSVQKPGGEPIFPSSGKWEGGFYALI